MTDVRCRASLVEGFEFGLRWVVAIGNRWRWRMPQMSAGLMSKGVTVIWIQPTDTVEGLCSDLLYDLVRPVLSRSQYLENYLNE